jgi:hypothetical protein
MEAQMMTRVLALPMLLLLAACSGLAPAKTEATAFESLQTGQVATGCGPMQGFKGAIDKAQHGCDQAWQAKGWMPLNESIAAVPE